MSSSDLSKSSGKIDKYIILIIAVLFFHCISNIIFLYMSRFELYGNAALFFMQSAKFLDNPVSAYLKSSLNYPPLLFLITGLFLKLFGICKEVAIMSNMLYFSVLLFSIYYLGVKIMGRKRAAFAAVLSSFLPGIFGYSRTFLLDFPAAATVLLFYCLAVYSDDFRDFKFTLLSALAFAAGMLMKWTFPVYVFPFFIYVFIRRKLQLRNFALFVIISTLISISWYIPNRKIVFDYLFMVPSVPTSEYNVHHLNYLDFFMDELMLVPFTLLMLISMVYNMIRKKHLLSLLALTVPVLMFSTLHNRNPRYVISVIPFASIIITEFIFSLCYRRAFAFIAVETVFIQYLMVSFFPIDIPFLRHIRKNIGLENTDQHGFYLPVDHGYWKTDKVLESILGSSAKDSIKNLLIISPFQRLIYPVMIENYIKSYNINLVSPGDQDQRDLPAADMSQYVISADYILYKTGDQGIPWHMDYVEGLMLELDKRKQDFKELGNWPLPDSSRLILLKRI